VLSNELMAGLALAVFWAHVLLIAGAAALDLRELLRLRGRLRRGLWAGTVRRGDGADGVFARNVVAQIGRGRGDGRIHFSDAAHRSEVFGGLIEVDVTAPQTGAENRMAPQRGAENGTDPKARLLECAAVEAPVWPDLERRAAAARASSDEDIARVEAQARRAKGWEREVVGTLAVGDRVWIAGALHEDRVEDVLVVSAIDPRRWLAGRCWLIVAFIVADLVVATGCTVLALWPPVFDVVSMLGAAAALGFFLGVQPLGVSVNEAVRTPERAYLRGTWSRGK
jgi:hypothetical protein